MSEDKISLPAGFGTTNYSDSKYQIWKLPKADGTLLLRPLPPMKSMQGRSGVGLYWKTHFGWSGRDAKSPKGIRFRPFLCVEEKDYGKIVVSCPACELRKKRQDKINLLKLKGKEKGATAEQIRNVCAPHEQWLRDHGLDGKVRIPCVNKQGQVGLFLAPYGIFKDFRDKCRQLNQKGHDPAGPKGIFFEFIRTGQASPTSDSCEPHRISREVDGETVEKLDFHVLTNELAKAALDNIPDLNELMEKGRISVDKIQALCELTETSDGSYDPDEVDRIMGVEKRSAPKAAPAAEVDFSDDEDAASPPPPVETKTKAKTAAPPPVSLEDDEDFSSEEPAPKAAPKTSTAKPAAPKAAVDAAPDADEYDNLFS